MQKRSTEPIQSTSDRHAQILQAGAISKLPSEILTQILSYILTKSGPIILYSASARRWRSETYNLSIGNLYPYVSTKALKSPLLDILLVSRAFYFAGIAAFFRENVLKFDNVQHLDRLTSKLDTDRRRCIRRVVFQFAFHDLWCSELKAFRSERMRVGERLGVCLQHLPSLVQVQFCWWAMYCYRRLEFQKRVQELTRLFEDIKEFCGSRREVLELEIPHDMEDPDL